MLGGDDRAVLIGSDWGAEAAYGAAAFAPDRWRRVVTIGVPPLALDTRIFADYDQLKKFFYLFFLKTPLAESVLAAADMAFLHRLWQDWSPGYDARENLRDVKQCLGGESHLAAAMGYYRAPEPGLSGFDTDGAYAAQEQALARCGPRNPRSTCTAVVTAVSTSRSSKTLSFTLRPGQEWRWWPTTATFSRSRSRR